jgi:heme/copper-type cytochrome/quinol oxidase subunit 3
LSRRERERIKLGDSIVVTIVLGTAFLLGVVALEWPTAIAEGLTPSSGVAGAVFFMMTGMHALHVLTGVVFLLIIYRNGRRGLYTRQKHYAVEAAAVYWHFVDVVWIFFYPALYLSHGPLGLSGRDRRRWLTNAERRTMSKRNLFWMSGPRSRYLIAG